MPSFARLPQTVHRMAFEEDKTVQGLEWINDSDDALAQDRQTAASIASDVRTTQSQMKGSDSEEEVILFKGRASRKPGTPTEETPRRLDSGAVSTSMGYASEETRVSSGQGKDATDDGTGDDPSTRVVHTSKGVVTVHGEGSFRWFTGSEEAMNEYKKTHAAEYFAKYSGMRIGI